MSDPTVSPIQQAEASFAVALVIDVASKGVAAKKVALATALLVYVNALKNIAEGDIADGAAALLVATQSPNLDPGIALGLKSLLQVSNVELTALATIEDGNLAGQAELAIAASLLTAAGIALQAYIPVAPVSAEAPAGLRSAAVQPQGALHPGPHQVA